MADGNGLRSVADALAEVAKWRTDEEARHSTELAEVDQEVASLQTGIENLKQQLEALGRFRTELLSKVDEMAGGVAARSYDAVFGALAGQQAALGGRAGALLEKERLRDAKLGETLSDPHVRNLMAEYQQFKDNIQPTLATLPPSYRSAMEEIGRKQREDLTARLGNLGTEPVAHDGDIVNLDVLIAVDAPDGQAEVLMIVLPVDDAVHAAWSSREEDLQTRLAARVMQGVFATAAEMGLAGNQGVFGGHKGMLAVEVELNGGSQAEVADRFRRRIESALASAPEVVAAKVRPTVRVMDVDHLLPPEQTDEEHSA